MASLFLLAVAQPGCVLIGYDGRDARSDEAPDAGDSVLDDGAAFDPGSSGDSGAAGEGDGAAQGLQDGALAGRAEGAMLTPPADDNGDQGEDTDSVACDTSLLGVCWYLGAYGQSCRQTCEAHGGYDARTPTFVGSSAQGGSAENCHAVLSALGSTGNVVASTRPDELGLGCHQWSTGINYWLNGLGQGFDPDDSGVSARIACGCLQ
ncbi:MAG: hypothetical protein QM778_06965 [Myxococcales bacterium]